MGGDRLYPLCPRPASRRPQVKKTRTETVLNPVLFESPDNTLYCVLSPAIALQVNITQPEHDISRVRAVNRPSQIEIRNFKR